MSDSSQEHEAEVRELTQLFADTFGSLSTPEINWKPNEATWSVGQNIEHLIRVNESYFPILEQIRDGSYAIPFWGKLPGIPTFFARLILGYVDPAGQRKAKTFAIWQPSSSSVDGDIVRRFTAHHQELLTFIQESADLRRSGTIISSPANRVIVYPMETAVQIVLSHERRHFNQARGILDLQIAQQRQG